MPLSHMQFVPYHNTMAAHKPYAIFPILILALALFSPLTAAPHATVECFGVSANSLLALHHGTPHWAYPTLPLSPICAAKLQSFYKPHQADADSPSRCLIIFEDPYIVPLFTQGCRRHHPPSLYQAFHVSRGPTRLSHTLCCLPTYQSLGTRQPVFRTLIVAGDRALSNLPFFFLNVPPTITHQNGRYSP